MKSLALRAIARALLLSGAFAAATFSLSALAVGHRADLAIHDRSTGRELPVHWHEGRAYVVGRPGNEYQVSVRNRHGEDVLAVLSVDGINVVSGATAATGQGGYVLSPWERLDVRGWRKSLGETAAFYFTSLGDSYAGRTGRPQNVGVIGVALFERKTPEPPRHYDVVPLPQPHARREGAADAAAESRAMPKQYGHAAPAPAAPLGTGHGRREESHARHVDFERASRTPVETIAIYYDSYRNLVAQGVLPAHGRARDPNPFPTGFVPDPGVRAP